MANYIGIDLGTTFSAVATLDETGRPIIIANEDGINITPSVVTFDSSNKAIVGEEARKALMLGAAKLPIKCKFVERNI